MGDPRILDKVKAPDFDAGQPNGVEPRFAWVDPRDLHVDRSYQRSISERRGQKLIEKIALRFDWRRFGALMLAETPDGRLMIIDGQHRAHGAAANPNVRRVPALIWPASYAEEAGAFAALNRDRIGMDRAALFMAEVASGDPEARAIADVLIRANVAVQRFPHPNGIRPGHTRAISSVEAMISEIGADLAAGVLGAIREAHPAEYDALSSLSIRIAATAAAELVAGGGRSGRADRVPEDARFHHAGRPREGSRQGAARTGAARLPDRRRLADRVVQG